MSNQGLFPQIIEVHVPQGRASNEKKCIFHEKVLYHYLERKIEGWSVKNFLTKEKIENYALYAVTDFTKLFLKDLLINKGNLNSVFICDKNVKAFQPKFRSKEVISVDELLRKYKKKEIKKIIIMSVLHENEIFDELTENGVLLNDIISFVSILYS